MRRLRHPLAKELAVAVAVKLAIVTALYFAFFSGGEPQPSAEAVARHLVNHPQE